MLHSFWCLRKNDISKMKKKYKEETYTYPDYALTLSVFSLIFNYKYPLQFHLIYEGSIS